MKHLFLITFVALAIFGLSSCTKNSPKSSGNNPYYVAPPATGGGGGGGVTPPATLPVGDVPNTFTKKALLEEFTGEWCGWCPEGAKIMDDLITANPNKVMGVAVHDGDPMEVASLNSYLKTLTGVSGFPNGTVQRDAAAGRDSWTGDVNAALAKPATCGLSMVTKINGTKIDVDVYVGYNATITSATKVTVYLTENNVPQSSPGAQGNYSQSVVVDPNTWQHQHVLRGALSDKAGNDATLNSKDKYTLVSFKGISLSSFPIKDINNVHVVAFVNASGLPTPSHGRDVLNSQECKLGDTKKWD
jgi:thiol-disulfide isomerase/thioredoxin